MPIWGPNAKREMAPAQHCLILSGVQSAPCKPTHLVHVDIYIYGPLLSRIPNPRTISPPLPCCHFDSSSTSSKWPRTKKHKDQQEYQESRLCPVYIQMKLLKMRTKGRPRPRNHPRNPPGSSPPSLIPNQQMNL